MRPVSKRGRGWVARILARILLGVVVLSWPMTSVFGQRVSGVERETIKAPDQAPHPAAPDLRAVETTIREQTNAFRKAQQKGAVSSDPKLKGTAEYFARFMAGTDQYGHHADERTPGERAKKHDYDFCLLSENIAYIHGTRSFSAEELAHEFVEGWKNSAEHRENMVDPDVRETGVGVARSSKSGVFYAVQLFGRPKSDAIQFEIVNQSPVKVHYRIRKNEFVLEPRYTRVHEICRPSDLLFQGPEPNGEPKSVFQPTSGDVLTVVADGETGVRVTQAKPNTAPQKDPASPPPGRDLIPARSR